MKSLSILALLVCHLSMYAGTLDDAPFHFVAPNSDWQISDSTASSMGDGVSLVASINNTNNHLKSVVIKTDLKGNPDSAFEELCKGISDTLSNPIITSHTENNTTFLGYHAKVFMYATKQDQATTYNYTVVFVADGKGWTIACIGRVDQNAEVRKMINFYQKKGG